MKQFSTLLKSLIRQFPPFTLYTSFYCVNLNVLTLNYKILLGQVGPHFELQAELEMCNATNVLSRRGSAKSIETGSGEKANEGAREMCFPPTLTSTAENG